MALVFSKTGVTTGQPVEADQISQSYDAFTGTHAYDVTISGSLSLPSSPASIGTDLTVGGEFSQVNVTSSDGGGGNVILKYNNNEKLSTFDDGVQVTEGILQENFTASFYGGVGTDNVILKQNNSTKLSTADGGILVTGSIDATEDLNLSQSLYVYSGSVNICSGNVAPTGSFISSGNLYGVNDTGTNRIQRSSFFVSNRQVSGASYSLFTFSPFKGLSPLPLLDGTTNNGITIKAQLNFLEMTTSPLPDGNCGYLEFVGVFTTSTTAYTIAEAVSMAEIANITTDIATSGTGDFVITNTGDNNTSIDVMFDSGGGFPTGGLQVGGFIEITVMTQLV